MTGGSAGIGFGIVAHLLQHNPNSITVLSNKEDHFKTALEELKEYGDTSKVHWMKCDLEDLKATDRVAKELASTHKKIDGVSVPLDSTHSLVAVHCLVSSLCGDHPITDVPLADFDLQLILNAGLGVGVYNETVDGIDSHFQVNHLSQFHLLLTLLPVLSCAPNPRIVLQASDLHRGATDDVQFADEAEINRDIGPTKLYNRTKLAQILIVRALARRISDGRLGDGKKIYVNAVHPGAVDTDQPLQAEEAYGTLGVIGHNLVKPLMKDPVSKGCRPALYAATSEEIVEKNIIGQYIVPDKKVTDPSARARDDTLGERLWALSEDMLKKRLG